MRRHSNAHHEILKMVRVIPIAVMHSQDVSRPDCDHIEAEDLVSSVIIVVGHHRIVVRRDVSHVDDGLARGGMRLRHHRRP